MPNSCDPMDYSTTGFSITNSCSLLKLMSIESVIPFNHLILCRPLLLLPSIVPRIRVFPNESALHIRWAKYWSFSFSISPSNVYSGLISFRIDRFDALLRWVWRKGRGPHLEGRQESQASSPFRTPTAGSLQSWDRRVRPRLV